ncbi:shikimate kinase [Pikeienuella sp. HZG-20]|uniref:shikimate kinase n=1 Tax=Paludibacillus litoralis TaxID=3133267 RepID=UPI0030EBA431
MSQDETNLRLRRPVALVGLMGCGKSTIGARLATLISAPFRDADTEIEAAAGMTIPEIFSTLGEAAFRDGEKRVIARLLAGPPLILATGGGAYMAPETRAAISAAGVAIWLHADIDTLVNRTAKRRSRPLLNAGDPREILARLMAERYPVYAGAEIRVESRDDDRPEDVAHAALAAIRAHDAAAPPALRILETADDRT